jgi:DEAD/DEAH box helicase domain-containing protein
VARRTAFDFPAFLARLQRDRAYQDQIVHRRSLAGRAARYAPLEPSLPDPLRARLAKRGVTRLYVHQAAAVDAVRRGEHVAVVTPTASGKTLCYNLPVLEHLAGDPGARAIYLFPTKALAQDQRDALVELAPEGVRVATYDGDTAPQDRRRIRDETHILLSNPDMMHVGILPQHLRWAEVLRRLRFVVIDDMHVYRGVFGSNVANVLRRLRRVCGFYGSRPQFICTSATIANPQEFTERLLGLEVTVIEDGGAPSGPREVVLWNPPFLDKTRLTRRSPYSEATWLFTALVREGVRTIAFTKARKVTELIYRYAQARLAKDAPEAAGRISPYRAGYLPEDRRRIEQRLFRGDLVGVVSTSALELGIDVGGLDAALLVGFPGTIASTWQRAGRAGRGRDPSLAVLIALDDALDQYLMRHPDYLFSRPFEHAVIDPENPYILAGHLRCAAAEGPLEDSDAALFGARAGEVASILGEVGDLLRRRGRWYWSAPERYPAAEVEVRSASGDTFRIIEEREGRLLGMVDTARAFESVHPGAIYLHQGDAYLVRDLDLQTRVASVAATAADHYTQPRSDTDAAILRHHRERPWGPTTAWFGDIQVTTQVTGYVRKQLFSEAVLGSEPLDLPPQTLSTTAVWFTVPEDFVREIAARGLDLAGGIHAAEHAAIGLLPLFAMCDRWDIGGVSYPHHPQTGVPTIFIYDGHPGGVGITEKGFALLEEWMTATLDAIAACPCEAGCPSCVQSPKCGNLNNPLDKAAALLLLQGLLARETASPASVRA